MDSHIDFIRHCLNEKEWRREKENHEEYISSLIHDYLEKRKRQVKNPVIDFLFEYYAFRPSHLKRWSPGFGVLLETLHADEVKELDLNELVYTDAGICLDPAQFPESRTEAMQWILTVLKNSAQTDPAFGCFGMHEWAMVYKKDHIRHSRIPLRMDEKELVSFVESRPVICTHFDAFRFFSKPARPMNKFELSRKRFPEMEQPGCVHTNMDLYKWAFKMYPWISSNTIRRAFELALEARFIDMKASPYDLREYDLQPIKIETEEGRLEYLESQRSIFKKSEPVRQQLIKEYEYLTDYFAG